MSGWSGSIPEVLYTYVQNSKPTDAEEGQSWYDLDDDVAYVFVDGQGTTTELTIDDHGQLAGIGPSDHHDPVSVSDPLSQSGQSLSMSLANALTVDAGSLAVVESQIALSNLSGYPVGTGDLGFDTATQSELDSTQSELDSHEGDTSNPHNTTVPASETNDGSDIEHYRVDDINTDLITVLDVTGSGVLLGGIAANESTNRDAYVEISVDGGPYQSYKLVTDSNASQMRAYVPSVEFNSSCEVRLHDYNSPTDWNASVQVKR